MISGPVRLHQSQSLRTLRYVGSYGKPLEIGQLLEYITLLHRLWWEDAVTLHLPENRKVNMISSPASD
jgi:hypothetical protein